MSFCTTLSVNLRPIKRLIANKVFLGLVIAWRFADPISFNRVFEDTVLEVVLVNARSDMLPERAQAIAQVRLAGGGRQE